MSLNDTQFLGREPVGKLLAKLSLPAIVGMVVNALYNLTDAIFIGQGTGPMGLAGLSIVFPIQMLISAFALTIGVGSAALISIRLGEGRDNEAAQTAANAQSFGLIISLILLGIIAIFQFPVLRIFGASPGILPSAKEYLTVVMWGFPLVSSLMVGNNILRSEGKPRHAMTIMLIGTGFNIILDPIFIFPRGEFLIGYFDMGIAGAALATVISQGLAFLYLVFLYLRRVSSLPIRKHYFIPKLRLLMDSILLGLPTFVRNAGTSLMVLIVNNSLIHYGSDLDVSVYGIINRILMFTLMPVFGVVQGFQPIAGYSWGAKLYHRLKELVGKAVLGTTLLSVISFLIMFLLPTFLLSLFTDHADLIQRSLKPLRLVVLFFPLLGVQFIGASYFQSIGKKVPSLLLGVARQFLFLPLLVLVLPIFLGLQGIWIAFPAADILSTLLTMAMMGKEWRALKGLLAVS